MLINTKITTYITTMTFEVEGGFDSQVVYTGTSVAAAFRAIREFDGESLINSMTTDETPMMHRGYVTEDEGDLSIGTVYRQTEWYKYETGEDGGTILFQIIKTQVEI